MGGEWEEGVETGDWGQGEEREGSREEEGRRECGRWGAKQGGVGQGNEEEGRERRRERAAASSQAGWSGAWPHSGAVPCHRGGRPRGDAGLTTIQEDREMVLTLLGSAGKSKAEQAREAKQRENEAKQACLRPRCRGPRAASAIRTRACFHRPPPSLPPLASLSPHGLPSPLSHHTDSSRSSSSTGPEYFILYTVYFIL